MNDTPTNDLIRDLAQFEDRIAVLERMTPEQRSAIVEDAPLNDVDAELTGCEGATLAIEQELQARGIKPSQAVAEYRAGNLSQHQADAYDADQDDDAPERSEAYRDGHESASETLGAASNPFTALCENGDEAACLDADNWQMGADAAQADLERADC